MRMEDYDLQEKEEALKALLDNEAFQYLNAMMQEQVDHLQQEIFAPCESVEAAWRNEGKKGQLRGMLAYGELILIALNNIELDRKRLREDNENAEIDN